VLARKVKDRDQRATTRSTSRRRARRPAERATACRMTQALRSTAAARAATSQHGARSTTTTTSLADERPDIPTDLSPPLHGSASELMADGCRPADRAVGALTTAGAALFPPYGRSSPCSAASAQAAPEDGFADDRHERGYARCLLRGSGSAPVVLLQERKRPRRDETTAVRLSSHPPMLASNARIGDYACRTIAHPRLCCSCYGVLWRHGRRAVCPLSRATRRGATGLRATSCPSSDAAPRRNLRRHGDEPPLDPSPSHMRCTRLVVKSARGLQRAMVKLVCREVTVRLPETPSRRASERKDPATLFACRSARRAPRTRQTKETDRWRAAEDCAASSQQQGGKSRGPAF